MGEIGMLNINTNYAASFASKAASSAQRGVDSAMEKLSSGSRINYAKDDAAGQAIATRLTAEVQGLAMASRNASDAQSMIDTADSALGETTNLLLRMRELAVQASNGTLSGDDRNALDAEYDQLALEIDRVDANTSWAGVTLFDSGAERIFHVGTNNTDNDKISITIGDMDAATLIADVDDDADTGTDAVPAGVDTVVKAQATISALDNAIQTFST